LTTIVVVKDTLLAPLSLQNLWFRSEVSPCVIFSQIEMFSPYSERDDMFEVWGLIAIPRLSVKTINVGGIKDELSMPVFDKIDWIFQTLVCFKAKRVVRSKYEKNEFSLLCSYVVLSFDEFSRHIRRCEENNKHLI